MKGLILLFTLISTSLFSCHGVSDEEFEELQQEVQMWKARYEALERRITNLLNDTDLEERVDALEEDVVDLDEDIDDLQDSQIIQDERFLAVEADVTDLEDDVIGLQETVIQHEDELTILDGTDMYLDSRIDNLETTDSTLQHNITELRDTDDFIQNDLEALEHHVNETIGFNAIMSQNPTCIDNILQFQNDLANVGQRYNPNTGKFTADRAGTYYFSAHLLTKENQNVNNATTFFIRKNSEDQCFLNVELDTVNTQMNNPGSCAAAIELLPGDEVYVACGNVNVLTTAYRRNGFTGFLVQQFL